MNCLFMRPCKSKSKTLKRLYVQCPSSPCLSRSRSRSPFLPRVRSRGCSPCISLMTCSQKCGPSLKNNPTIALNTCVSPYQADTFNSVMKKVDKYTCGHEECPAFPVCPHAKCCTACKPKPKKYCYYPPSLPEPTCMPGLRFSEEMCNVPIKFPCPRQGNNICYETCRPKRRKSGCIPCTTCRRPCLPCDLYLCGCCGPCKSKKWCPHKYSCHSNVNLCCIPPSCFPCKQPACQQCKTKPCVVKKYKYKSTFPANGTTNYQKINIKVNAPECTPKKSHVCVKSSGHIEISGNQKSVAEVFPKCNCCRKIKFCKPCNIPQVDSCPRPCVANVKTNSHPPSGRCEFGSCPNVLGPHPVIRMPSLNFNENQS